MELDAKTLKEVFAPVAAAADGGIVRITVSDGNMTADAKDEANVQYVRAVMPADTTETMLVHADPERLMNAINDLEGFTDIRVEGTWLKFRGNGSMRSLKLISNDPAYKLPNITSEHVHTVTHDFLARTVRMSDIDEAVTIKMQAGKLCLSAESELETAEYTIDIESGSYVMSMYPSKLLAKLVRTIRSDSITMTFDTNYPLKLEWGSGDALFTYCLAPRIEDT